MAVKNVANSLKVFAGTLCVGLLLTNIPLSSAASPSPTPSPRAWSGSATPTARPTAAATTAPSPAATKVTLSEQKLVAFYADTNVPQIVSINSSFKSTESLFTASLLIKVRVHRNTLKSLSIAYKPKVVTGPLSDPIFQAPCNNVEGVSVTKIDEDGNSVALQKREKDGDWYLEEYVLQSNNKVSQNMGPCYGAYLVTKISAVDTAGHTLNLDANLASTGASTNTAKNDPNQSKAVYTDVAIMTSNIWNSRPDLAPCVAGTNLGITFTSSVVNGKTTQVPVAPKIVNTDRIACAPTIGFNIVNPIFIVNENNYVYGKASETELANVDYASLANQMSSDLAKLKSDYAALLAKSESMTAEIAALKAAPVVVPSAKASPKATPKASAKASTKKTATPKATSTKRQYWKPTPKWTGKTGGSSGWNRSRGATPKPSAKK